MSIWSSVDCTAWASTGFIAPDGMYADIPKLEFEIDVAGSGMCDLIRLGLTDVANNCGHKDQELYMTREQALVLITALQEALKRPRVREWTTKEASA